MTPTLTVKNPIKQKTAPIRRSNRLNPSLCLSLFMLFLCLPSFYCLPLNNTNTNDTITPTKTLTLEGSFDYCEPPNWHSLVNINKLCIKPKKLDLKQLEEIKKNLGYTFSLAYIKTMKTVTQHVYGALDQKEFGNAFQCKKTQIIATYYSSF